MLPLSSTALSHSRSLTNWSGRKRLKKLSWPSRRKANKTKSRFQSNSDSNCSLINTTQKTKLPTAKIYTGGETFVPPVLLLPTSSRFAYVARAAFDDDSEKTDPRDLARKLFADVAADSKNATGNNGHIVPFTGARFEYFAPKSFQHELPVSIDQKGSVTPEVCFLGRSNVGKSSLINSLMKKDLARCSKHPGRTQHPYYYGLVANTTNNQRKSAKAKACTKVSVKPNTCHGFLVDLPGYGFASAPQKAIDHWQQDTQDFLANRRDSGSLQRLFLLIDARRGLARDGSATTLDLSVMRWMDKEAIPYTVVITKADCVSAPQVVKVANEACTRYQQAHQMEQEDILHDSAANDMVDTMGWMSPMVHITSAKKGEGLQELRSAVEAEFNTNE